jgi:DNA modification methylase
MLLQGNCLETLKTLPDCSVDSIVTDPPYELGFMGKSWDASGIAYNADLWAECLRVLKPGGHLLAFGGSRTYHRLACAVEDAGFEVRDQIMWIYGSGFPKSLDVSKAIDKAARAEREVVGYSKGIVVEDNQGHGGIARGGVGIVQKTGDIPITAPATPEAQRWQGWGTALKPAHEPICVARKPLIGTVANNVLTYGTGALNIDGTRVGYADGEVNFDRVQRQQHSEGAVEGAFGASALIGKEIATYKAEGRWPANVIHDGSDEVLAGFPNSKGMQTQRSGKNIKVYTGNSLLHSKTEFPEIRLGHNDDGSAARFFYCAKASKAERNAGLEGLPEQMLTGRDEGQDIRQVPYKTRSKVIANIHPTVKPLALMRYLVKLVTPLGGTVLDPFLGSGTTAVAAVLEGFDWVGCELTDEYWPIIEGRINWAQSEVLNQTPIQESLF